MYIRDQKGIINKNLLTTYLHFLKLIARKPRNGLWSHERMNEDIIFIYYVLQKKYT